MAHKDEPRRASVTRLLASGATGPEVARMLGVSRQRVHQLRKSMQLPVIPRYSTQRRCARKDMIPKLLKVGLNSFQIARYAQLGVNSIRSECAALGLSQQMKRNGRARGSNPQQLLRQLLALPLTHEEIARILDVSVLPGAKLPVTGQSAPLYQQDNCQ
jgi:transcriptional regulator with XRE-family HTH domain